MGEEDKLLNATVENNLSREEFERDFMLKDKNWFYKGMFDIWAAFLRASLNVSDKSGCALD